MNGSSSGRDAGRPTSEHGALELRDLTFGYVPDHPILDGVSLTVHPGEIVALLGPSGSGKSTLLRCAAGLEAPWSGDVRHGGRSLRGIPTHRRRIGLMFQEPALFPHLDVRGNVAFGIRYRPDAKNLDVHAETTRWLRLVALDEEAHRHVDALSGGQRQRVALARTLAAAPRALLLDEPLSALDHDLRVALGTEIRSILRNANVPVLWVTHDETEAERVADRVLRIGQDGRIAPARGETTTRTTTRTTTHTATHTATQTNDQTDEGAN